MADPNQTPARGDWACPCSGCAKAVAFERKQLRELLIDHDVEYLKYRGSSFDVRGVVGGGHSPYSHPTCDVILFDFVVADVNRA